MKALLVLRSAALGDFILSAPAFDQLRRVFPHNKIIFVTTQSVSKKQRIKVADYAGNTINIPWVDMAIPHLIDETFVIDNVLNFYSLWALRKKLKTYDFETAILMVDPCAPWLGRIKKLLLIYFLVGFIPTLGWRSQGSLKGNLSELNRKGLLKHHVYGPLQFLSEITPAKICREEEIVFDLKPGKEAEDWAENWIKTNQLENRPIIAVAPGAIHAHKQWPVESFKELIHQLLDRYPNNVLVVLGSPKDRSIGEELKRSHLESIFNLAGETSISQSAALLKKCALLVGNDGGAMHLGDAMGCKVVSIIPGIEYPDSIEPWHNKDLAVRHPVPCAPCYSFTYCPEKHNKCMTELSVESVFEKCRRVLDKTRLEI